MNLLVTSTKKTKNDIIKIINPEEFLKFYVKKDTLKDSLNFQLTKIKRQIPQLSKIYDFSLTRRGKKKGKCKSLQKVPLFVLSRISMLMAA